MRTSVALSIVLSISMVASPTPGEVTSMLFEVLS